MTSTQNGWEAEVKRYRDSTPENRTCGRVAVVEPTAISRVRGVAFLIAIAAVTLMVVLLQTAPVSAAVSYDSEELAFLRAINGYRVAAGRPALLLSDQLSLTAERHARDMGENDFFSHTSEKSSRYPVGSEFWQRLEYDGYAGAASSGENLAAGSATGAEVFALWKASTGHDANMLDPWLQGTRLNFRAIGIARVFALGSTYGWYWVTDFGGIADSTAHDPFAVVNAGGGPFPDVPVGHLYSQAIRALSDASVIDGYGDGSFRPDNPVWRQHFAKMIVTSLGLPVSESNRAFFADVDDYGPDTFYPDNFIAVAASTGITQGVGGGRFAPKADISRAQVVSMVVRAAQSLRPGTLDAPPAGYSSTWGVFSSDHQENARIAQHNGLLAGLPLANLDPWGKMTRGEAAQILANLRTLIGG